MTKTTSKLIQLKLDTIKFHEGEGMDYLMKGIARDACYTSFNSLQYKKKVMADTLADFETALAENRDTRADAINRKLENMHVELEHLIERHDADKAVYEIICDGEEWSPTQRSRNVTSELASKVSKYKSLVGA